MNFNPVSRIDDYLDALAKISKWILSLAFTISILSLSAEKQYIFQNIELPKHLTFAILAFLAIIYALLTGIYIKKIRIFLFIYKSEKSALLQAIKSHSSLFNIFYQVQNKGLVSRIQANAINITHLVLISLSLVFYYMESIPELYSKPTLSIVLIVSFGSLPILASAYIFNKWSMNSSYAIFRDITNTKHEGRKLVLRTLTDIRFINLMTLMIVGIIGITVLLIKANI